MQILLDCIPDVWYTEIMIRTNKENRKGHPMTTSRPLTSVTFQGRTVWSLAQNHKIPAAPAGYAMYEDQEHGVAGNDPELVTFAGIVY